MGNKNLMFEMTVDVAMEFYERVIKTNATTLEEKTQILIDLAKEGKMKSVMSTNRSVEEVAKDMSKHFGKVLVVKGKKNAEQKD